jgi:lysophospholipase L1-like esterase
MLPDPGTSLGGAVMPVARFIARPPKIGSSDRVTLDGSSVLALANDGGTAGAMTSDPGKYCVLDTSAPQNGYAAIRTASKSSDLAVATGGPSGAGAWHMFALAYPITVGNAAGNATFMLSGTPGAASNGIGSTSDGHEWWAGNNSASAQSPHDQALHLYELSSNGGGQLTAHRDGGLVASAAGATTLSSGAMGFRGWYPLPDSHGPPDTRIYWAAWFDHELTGAERRQVHHYLGKEYAYRPRRFISATGDSITAGHIATINTTSFVEILQAQYAAAGESVYILNAGISSQTSAQIAARSPSTFADYYAQGDFRDEWLIIGGGTNDSGPTPEQTYANLASVSVAAQALGIRTAIGTVLYFTAGQMTPAAYARLDALNALIRANACGADRVIDYYVDPLLATPTLAHFPDTIHPDDTALAAMATVQRSVIQ